MSARKEFLIKLGFCFGMTLPCLFVAGLVPQFSLVFIFFAGGFFGVGMSKAFSQAEASHDPQG